MREMVSVTTPTNIIQPIIVYMYVSHTTSSMDKYIQVEPLLNERDEDEH